MIKAVVFDLDDTLYSEKEYVISGLKYIAKYLSSIYDLDNIQGIMIEQFRSGNTKKLFNYVLDYYNIKYNKYFIQKLVLKYRSHIPDITLPRQTKNVLNILKQRNKILAIITDGYLKAQKNKVEKLGLNGIFNKIYFTDEFGSEYWKPSQFIFKKCQKQFKLKSEEIIYVGDNWQKDFFPANQLGWKTIGINNESKIHNKTDVPEKYKPQIVISNLKEVINYID